MELKRERDEGGKDRGRKGKKEKGREGKRKRGKKGGREGGEGKRRTQIELNRGHVKEMRQKLEK